MGIIMYTPDGFMSAANEAWSNAFCIRRLVQWPGRHSQVGTKANCRYDVLVKNYDANARDLLIEVKPDPDKGALRIAIGQLFDYRRFLPKQAATDLAVLTIKRPATDYIELLKQLQITCVWFVDDTLNNLAGSGTAWDTFATTIGARASF
jgi:hypothetical protein